MPNRKETTNVMPRVMLRCSEVGMTVWRNNVGTAWRSNNIQKKGRYLILEDAVPINYGLFKGSSDLIGLRPRLIAERDVGTTIAQFAAIEIKTARGKMTMDQQHFGNFVASKWGLFLLARGPEDIPDE